MKKYIFIICLLSLSSCEKIETLAKDWSKPGPSSSASPSPDTLGEGIIEPSVSDPLPGSPSPNTDPSADPSTDPSADPSPKPSVNEPDQLGFSIRVKSTLKQPLNNVLITLEPGLNQGWTFNDGAYTFAAVKPQKYTVHIYKDGFIGQDLEVNLNSENKPLNVELVPTVDRLEILPKNPRVTLGVPLALDAMAYFKDGTSSRQIRWEVKDPSIAKVNDKGELEGIKAGKTQLQASVPGEKRWLKTIDIEVVRHIFNVIGPGRLNARSKVHFIADPPTDAVFLNATYTWRAEPTGGIRLTPHPAANNIVIVEAETPGEFTLIATLKTASLSLDSKPLNISIEE